MDPNIFPVAWKPFFVWAEQSALGTMVRDSIWQFAAIEAVHLLALAVIGGAVLIVDLRLLGLALQRQSVSAVARDAAPWLLGSLITMLITGWVLMASLAASKYYVNFAFQLKMLFLLLAIVFTFTVRRRVLRTDEARVGTAWGKLVALISLALWFGVGAGGRWIGFSG